MPDYTFLVIANKPVGRNARIGKISSFQVGDGVWGRKEVPPRFNKISFSGTEEEAKYILNNCDYDFVKEEFVDTYFRDKFQTADIAVRANVVSNKNGEEEQQLVTLLTGKTERKMFDGDFVINFDDDKPHRERILFALARAIRTHRATIDNVVPLVRAVRFGGFADVRREFRALSLVDRQKILGELKPKQRRWLRWLCTSNNKEEADAIMGEA